MELPSSRKCDDAAAYRGRLREQWFQATNHLHARGTLGREAMNDPIVDEVRRIRDAHAARFNYDLGAIFRDLKEQERKSGRKFVSFGPRKIDSTETPLVAPTAIPACPDVSPIEPTSAADR
jgi:hypothetical protein